MDSNVYKYRRNVRFAKGARIYFQPFIIENPTTLMGHAGRKLHDVTLLRLIPLKAFTPRMIDLIDVTAKSHEMIIRANTPPASV